MAASNTYNIDCLDFLRQQPDKSFDLAIVEPPYFSGPERRSFFGSRQSVVGVNRIYRKTDVWQVPGEEYFNELLRVARHYIIWGCNYYDFKFAPGRIVWDKCNDSSDYSDCELAATDLISSIRIFRFMWNGMCQGKSITEGHIMQGNKKLNEKRIHPTQKPILLYAWLLSNFAEKGWSILDTHLGSGSSRIAAYKLDFDFTGCEIDLGYFEAQEARFQSEVNGIHSNLNATWKQLSIFD